MSACLNCGEALDSTAKIHANGQFRCEGGGWAEEWTPDALAGRIEHAREEGYSDGYREAEYEYDNKVDDAYDDGRADGRKEIISRVQAAITELRSPDVYLTAYDVLSQVEEALR
ncbi:hypothetical protein FHT44_004993 [Mycolicibacterium sp. BK634]|uniref:hypothetical protein n=1 Tax=Mycolicibacterium sp. BK634 TaxID=2587099 RepID=UPI0016148194|nr:hypothetical protein [Mycolicibacterium sp. BK634]MBB3752481.1 hypothetical protein [Mycolicibacterium sp. BK634]